ncbi:MAG TPA: hypothetical protein VG796_14865 [Verrucomicrobiales bacterium]|nr:hypothetical protein [Verrucomicrobiales bacterium]
MAGKPVPCDVCGSEKGYEGQRQRSFYVGAAVAAWLKERGGKWIFHPQNSQWVAALTFEEVQEPLWSIGDATRNETGAAPRLEKQVQELFNASPS